MGTFFSLFGRHGFKTWLTYLLGAVITGSLIWIIWFIGLLIGGILLFAGILPIIAELSLEDPESWESLIEVAPGLIVGTVLFLIIMILITLPFLSFLNAGLFSAVRENVFENRFSFGTFFSGGFSNLWRVLKQSFLFFLLYAPLIALFFLSVIFLFAGDLQVLGLLILLLLLIIVPFILMGTMFAPAILITEKTGAFRSINTSFRLLFRSFGKVLLTFIAVAGTAFGLSILLILPVTLFFLSITGDTDSSWTSVITTPYEYLVNSFITVLCTFILFFRYQQIRPVLFPADPGSEGTGGGTGGDFRQGTGGKEIISVTPFLDQHEAAKPGFTTPVSRPADPLRKDGDSKEKQERRGYPSSPFRAIPFPEEKPPTLK